MNIRENLCRLRSVVLFSKFKTFKRRRHSYDYNSDLTHCASHMDEMLKDDERLMRTLMGYDGVIVVKT